MTVSEVIIDLSEYNHDDNITIEPTYIEDIVPRIEDLTVSPCPVVVIQAPGAPEPPTGCPGALKYSGNTVTLKATPRNGIGPYYVEFRKNDVFIDPSRLGGTNPGTSKIYDAPEDVQITRVYTLDDADIASATGGAIDFSVFISDKCPTGAQSCESICTINIGCVAPVCNFTVT